MLSALNFRLKQIGHGKGVYNLKQVLNQLENKLRTSKTFKNNGIISATKKYDLF